MNRCEHCPAEAGTTCPSVRHPHYCNLANREGPRREYWREYLRTGAIPEPQDGPSPPPFVRPDGRIRVGFHTPSFYRGGAERWVLDLARTLDGMRFRVVGFSCTDPSVGSPDLEAEARSFAPILVGREGMRELDRDCDVMIVWGDHDVPGLIGDPRSKIVIVSHTSGEWGARAVSGWERAAGLVAVSPIAATPFPEEARGRVVVIPNGFQASRIVPRRRREDVRGSWGIGPEDRVLGVLGRISPEKGPDHLANAVSRLPWRWNGVHVGDGMKPFRDAVIHRAHSVAPGRMVYPGYDPDVGGVLHAFDAFLLASEFEGSSLALLEAWAAGVPCLATPVGIASSHPELVRKIGLPVDPREIARSVLDDEMDPEGTGRRVRLARETAERLYSGREWADRWGEYLEGIAGVRRKSSSVRTTKPMTGIPYAGDLPPMPHRELQLLNVTGKTCRFRGCRTTCTTFSCERYSEEISYKQCVQCVMDGGFVPPLDARVQPLRETSETGA